MSKRPMDGAPLTDAQHAEVCGIFGNLIQETKEQRFGGFSQVWFTLNDVAYHAVIERCTGPLLDVSPDNLTPSTT